MSWNHTVTHLHQQPYIIARLTYLSLATTMQPKELVRIAQTIRHILETSYRDWTYKLFSFTVVASANLEESSDDYNNIIRANQKFTIMTIDHM